MCECVCVCVCVCVCACARLYEVVDGVEITDDRVQCRGDGNSFNKGAELLTG